MLAFRQVIIFNFPPSNDITYVYIFFFNFLLIFGMCSNAVSIKVDPLHFQHVDDEAPH